MLRTHNLTFSYLNGPAFAFPDIACERSSRVLVIGESGRGKTTFLHLVAGILIPVGGEVEISGVRTSSLSKSQLDQLRGREIGMIFQTSHFVEALSVLDNLILPNYLTGKKAERTRAIELLNRLGLSGKAHRRPGSLSVGEQQRVAIARSVMNRPGLILADEPTSALDDRNAMEVVALLEEYASESGAALVIVTHDGRLKNHYPIQVEL